ncbi:RNA methyltransferase [Moraxella sp. FZLJ2107]|uniref:RNA methyltransferase n=1 Tax=unclassified Moraxella TaxID=2685852 RepID=UPI0020C83799|nr:MULTISPECIES: RNA methyltransferase [unclassified Moraxella]UTO05291.1 RNA methyltransferase [Moraxella sp. FZLJ2107]UTO22026.1 RNA methyltransferase [Moraxella sp. FZLJ2109]
MTTTAQHYLAQIRIVMVETTLPANIGSAARAMHTMSLSDLVVVNPRLPIDDTSHANAAGATQVLSAARIVPTLDDALADCSLVFAASARSRQMPRPVVTPQMAAQIAQTHFGTHSSQTDGALPTIAILFGRENHGLNNDELGMAHYHIQIPANPAYPVLNVAAAIQVIASYLYEQLGFDGNHSTKQTQGVAQISHPLDISIRSDWDEPAATHAQMASLDDAIISLMQKLNLANDQDLKHLPNRLARLTHRLQLDQKEYALIRALLAKLDQKIK